MVFRTQAEGWRRVGIWALRLFAILLVGGALMSTTDFNWWWIRI